MSVTKGPTGSPLALGKTFPVLKNQPLAAGTDVHKFGVDADGILIWVDVFSVTGSVTVTVDTIGDNDTRTVIGPLVISSPTAEPLIRTAVNILSTIRVTVSYTGSCDYIIRARGISRGGATADDAPLEVEVDLGPVLVNSPTIQNINLTTAGEEQAVVLASVRRFKFQALNAAKLDYAYVPLSSESFTVFPGYVEEESNINDTANLTIYMKSNKDNTIVQLLSWT